MDSTTASGVSSAWTPQLRGVGEAVRIDLFHLPGLVRMEQEVAARGATRQGQRSARVHDARTGHAPSTEANSVPKPRLVISRV
jgi:hypothetical protein